MSRCASCGVGLGEQERCRACGALVLEARSGPPVVVAFGAAELTRKVAGVLADEGFSPVHAPSGGAVLAALDRAGARALVLDVAIEEPPAFQVIERVRARGDLGASKIVLIASVYDRTAYKRRPTSLYGADDYVEQHHIPDMLPRKLGELLGVRVAGTAAGAKVSLRREIRQAEVAAAAADAAPRAVVLAKRVVADVALYHQADVIEAVGGRVTPSLAAALAEAQRVLAQMLGSEPPPHAIDEAWSDLLAAMTGAKR